METLRRAQAEPLLEALQDPPPETRLAVLDALTRLPLDPDSWFAVRPYVGSALDDPTAPEHLGVIEFAARVPIRSLRHQLGVLAREGSPEERALAAGALAEVLPDGLKDGLVEPLPDAGRVEAELRPVQREHARGDRGGGSDCQAGTDGNPASAAGGLKSARRCERPTGRPRLARDRSTLGVAPEEVQVALVKSHLDGGKVAAILRGRP